MDLLDTYINYEAYMTRHFIEKCRQLTPEQMHKTFDIGPGNLYDTIAHVIRNLELWTDQMREVPFQKLPPVPEDIDGMLERYDSAMAYFTENARSIVADNRLDDTFDESSVNTDSNSDEPPFRVRQGVTILHVLTHTTGHHWEMQHMLQRLGVKDMLDGDIQEWDLRTRYNMLP